MALEYKHEEMATWPLRKTARRSANFDNAKGRISFTQTLTDLEREKKMLRARDVVIATGHPASCRRNDGKLRADARQPVHPGVIVRWTMGYGDNERRYALECDQYNHWEYNVRAIAKTIEMMRAVGRYGCMTSGGPLERHWELLLAEKLEERIAEHMRIEAKGAAPTGESASLPERLKKRIALARELASIANVTADPAALLNNPVALKDAYKIAAFRVHPDTIGTGSEAMFQRLQQIRTELEIG